MLTYADVYYTCHATYQTEIYSFIGDVTAGMTHLGLHSYFHLHKEDAITGLDTLTNYDRPDWRRIFGDLSKQHPQERVGVFFCGPLSLGKQVCTSKAVYLLLSVYLLY